MSDDLTWIGRLLAKSRERHECDARRYADLDWDVCQLCEARGEDKRTLTIDCFYAIHEVVPEAIDLLYVPLEDGETQRGYMLRVCKTCRAGFLTHLGRWRAECLARRGTLMDHNGCPEVVEGDRDIPVRVNGAVVMMTEEEWQEYQAKKEELHGTEQ